MKTYMFCNAHLDPVWLWQWESGLAEALSTYRTGHVDSCVVDGKEYLKPGAFTVNVHTDAFNCWEGKGALNVYEPTGQFHLMTAGQAAEFAGVKGGIVQPVRVTDEGDVNAVVEADFMYNNSRLLMRYIIDKVTGVLEVELRVFNAENEKRFKLWIPTTLTEGEHMGQTIFGREILKRSYADVVSQYWQAVADGESALTVIDDGVYGSNYFAGNLGVTLLRSAGYGSGNSAWGEPFHETMYQQRMDQGERRYRFRIMAGGRNEMLLRADREAAVFNQKAYALAFCPSGNGTKPEALVSIDRENITLSCFKRSERNENTYIMRLFEAQGIESDVHVDLPVFGLSLDAHFGRFEIRTFRISDGTITETDMLEGAVPIEPKQ